MRNQWVRLENRSNSKRKKKLGVFYARICECEVVAKVLSTASSNSLVSSYCYIVHYLCSVRALFVLKPMYPMWIHGQIKLSESESDMLLN